jgi:hypothetical protein
MSYQQVEASSNCLSLADIVNGMKVPGEEDNIENVIYIDSFFIPHVFDNVTLDHLVEMIETSSPYKGEGDTSIGVVDKIESIPKINQKNGHSYYSCFVTLKSWADNDYARNLMMKLYNDEQSRLYYKPEESINATYIAILPNKSETSMMDTPNHTDLLLYLHSDIRLETVMSVMEGLDIGKIHSIESRVMYNQPNDYPHELSFNQCEFVNPERWNQKVNHQYIAVYVRFSYWYKTQTAYNFKREMINLTHVNVPVFNGTVWTFYEIPPKYEGVNPYVWQR